MNAPEIDEKLITLAGFLDQQVLIEIYGQRMGFILLVAPFDDQNTGLAHYIANGTRETCIKWLEETLDRLKNNETMPATQGNA